MPPKFCSKTCGKQRISTEKLELGMPLDPDFLANLEPKCWFSAQLKSDFTVSHFLFIFADLVSVKLKFSYQNC